MKNAVKMCFAAVLLAMAGCATPSTRVADINHYSTVDPASVAPSPRILQHGPYELQMMAPIYGFSAGASLFYAPKRGLWTEYPAGDRDFRKMVNEKIEHDVREMFNLPGPAEIEDWLMYFQSFWLLRKKVAHFRMDPLSSDNDFRLFAQSIRWAVYSGNEALSRCDFNTMYDYTVRHYREVFPKQGSGKRLIITPICYEVASPSEDPEIPCIHAIWAICAWKVLDSGKPCPRFRFLTFPAKAGGPVHVDAVTGQATLETEHGTVSLYGPSGPDYLGERFAAAVIQLLEGMSDEELDALEDVEW